MLGCRAVYNDFDLYVDTLATVDTTNKILMAIKRCFRSAKGKVENSGFVLVI